MIRQLLDALFCRLGRCRSCTTHETPDGIGGKCVRCGRIHGWVTIEELRRVPVSWEQP